MLDQDMMCSYKSKVIRLPSVIVGLSEEFLTLFKINKIRDLIQSLIFNVLKISLWPSLKLLGFGQRKR